MVAAVAAGHNGVSGQDVRIPAEIPHFQQQIRSGHPVDDSRRPGIPPEVQAPDPAPGAGDQQHLGHVGIDSVHNADEPGGVHHRHVHLEPVIFPPVDEDHILEISQIPADHLGGHHIPLGMEAAELQQFPQPLVLRLHADQFRIVLAQLFIFLFQGGIFLFQGRLGGKIGRQNNSRCL